MHKYIQEYNYNLSADKLFVIVKDVEKYPEFLPWCDAARIISKGENYFYADLIINFKSITEKYTSKVSYLAPLNCEGYIISESNNGPFKRLYNKWEFIPQGNDHSKVLFNIEFEFKSIILNKLIGALFEKAVSKMTKAFEERAKSINKL